MVTFYLFLLGVAALGAGAYLALYFSHIPGATEERLGEWEPLPARLGEWIEDEEKSSDGLVVECRHLLPESQGMGGQKILLQVRYRDPESREIKRVDEEIVKKRKRVKN